MPPSPLVPAHSPLRRLRAQLRLHRERLTVLLPVDGYYVQAECARALRNLGHTVIEVQLGQQGELSPGISAIALLLRAVAEHKPDFLLSINYLGFDRAGHLDAVIEAAGLPCAVWLVDSPFVLALGYLPPAPSVTTLFVWDRSYLPVLQRLGAPRVQHLPLATCPSVFAPPAQRPARQLPFSFVGHSLAILCARWQAHCTPADQALAVAWQQRLLAERQALHAFVPALGRPIDARVHPLAYATYLASAALRTTLLRALPPEGLHVFGDADWARRLPRAHVHGTTAYGAEAARVFQASTVNVNVTSLQMPSTVNQRVFDVPASGGFLLTDRQAEVGEYFELEQEVATFASADELRDKAGYYSRHEKARLALVARAQARIAREHHYEHRLRRLLAVMRAHHGQRPVFGPPARNPCGSPPPPN